MCLNDTLAALVLVVHFAELVFPMITTLLPSSIVCLVCFILWFFFVTMTDAKFLLLENKFVLLVIYAFLAIYPAFFGYSTISNRYLSMSLIFCGSIVFCYYKATNKLFILKKVLIVTLILSFITMLITYEQLLLFPYISRSIKSGGEHSAILARRGIGGYAFIYYITALSIPALYYGIKAKQKRKRILAIIWYSVSVLFIIKSNYVTALLTIVVCSAVLVMFFSTSKKIVERTLGLFFGTLLIILFFNMENIVNLIADYLPNRTASVLVSQSDNSVTNSIMQEFFRDRWPMILISINAFLDYPVLGLIGCGALGSEGKFLTGFGQHSFVFDTFALFGLFGGTVGVFAVLSPMKKSDVWMNHSSFRIAMIVCMVMLYFLNNATESIALVFSIIAPYCAYILDYDEKMEV